jgi:polysaccharide export outer membrane protein
MENGDTVYVRRAPMFYIYGEIQRAGAYRLDTDTNVMRAISVGGGITIRGTQRGVQIHRRTADGELTRVNVALGDPVQADDIIYVSESLF